MYVLDYEADLLQWRSVEPDASGRARVAVAVQARRGNFEGQLCKLPDWALCYIVGYGSCCNHAGALRHRLGVSNSLDYANGFG